MHDEGASFECQQVGVAPACQALTVSAASISRRAPVRSSSVNEYLLRQINADPCYVVHGPLRCRLRNDPVTLALEAAKNEAGWTIPLLSTSSRRTVAPLMPTSRTYYAHSGNHSDRSDWHPLAGHLLGTAKQAHSFLEAAGCSSWGEAAGLLHDLGKYSGPFQGRLTGDPRRVNHSTSGARVALERYGAQVGKLLAFCVAGHHAGLANGVNGERITALRERIEEDGIPEIDDTWKDEIALPGLTDPGMRPRSTEYRGFSLTFLCRMIFSALVDADYLDTEAYYDKLHGHGNPRGEYPSVKVLAERASRYLDNKEMGSDPTPLNDLRRRVLQHVREQAPSAQGVFTLTVPTGGGKTLNSFAFALEHALTHGLQRIIYVIPYTSIVEQTARVFRDALRQDDADPADFVLEHHSAFDAERMGSREGRDKLGLAMENWDVPVVVTTAVQFFESLFANRTSRCRKLHNIANSVVILDEAQTLPLKYSRPCVAVLDELARNWNTTIVLCTATQSALRDGDFPGGFEEARELAPDPEGLYRAGATRRTQIVRAGHRGRSRPRVLCRLWRPRAPSGKRIPVHRAIQAPAPGPDERTLFVSLHATGSRLQVGTGNRRARPGSGLPAPGTPRTPQPRLGFDGGVPPSP